MNFWRWLTEPDERLPYAIWPLLFGVIALTYYTGGYSTMGVIPCDREGCQGVMCQQYVHGERICGDCLDEFKGRFGHESHSEEEWLLLFHQFMGTENVRYTDGESLDAFLEKHMRER